MMAYFRRRRTRGDAVINEPPPVSDENRAGPPDFIASCTGRGIEIGAHDLPIPGLSAIYVDQCLEYAHKPTLVDVLATAGALPFADSSVDYVAASHVIEHMPRTMHALREWYRVVKDGGHLYLVVPDKRKTFDRDRSLTPVEHILEDDRDWSPLRDLPHAVEIAFSVPFEVLEGRPAPPGEERSLREQYCRRLVAQLLDDRPIDIHHHVWTPENFLPIVERLGWDVRAVAEDHPAGRADGFGVLIQVHK